jgi:hypothetical protein
MFLVVIILAVGATIGIVKAYRHWQAPTTNFVGKLAICIIAVGLIGFCEPALVLFPPELLAHLELPNTLFADRLTAPDGRVFIVSSLIQRVQRYGPEGFENGFWTGKVSSSAISASGDILICSPGGVLLTYTPDGNNVPPSRSCRNPLGQSAYYPSDAKVPTIAFNWFSVLAVPLWHPFVAWGIMGFGSILFKNFGAARRLEGDTRP